jgi:hypothetical protein
MSDQQVRERVAKVGPIALPGPGGESDFPDPPSGTAGGAFRLSDLSKTIMTTEPE